MAAISVAEMVEIVVLPLVVVPMIGTTGMMLPRRSAKSPPLVAMFEQLVGPVHSAFPT